MTNFNFTEEQLTSMLKNKIITEEELIQLLAPTVQQLPPSKIKTTIKTANMVALGFGASVLAKTVSEKLLPETMNPLLRLIAKYTTSAIFGALVGLAGKEANESIEQAHLLLYKLKERQVPENA